MDQLLFDRATGNLGPNLFARLQITRLLRNLRPAPHHRFDGGQRGTAIDGDGGSSNPATVSQDQRTSLWAHQTGVNALALERFDGRV